MLFAFPSAIYASTTTNGVEFLFPTLNVTLHYGDYVQVQYISNFSDPWLFAFCLAADGSIPGKWKLTLEEVGSRGGRGRHF